MWKQKSALLRYEKGSGGREREEEEGEGRKEGREGRGMKRMHTNVNLRSSCTIDLMQYQT